MADGGQNWLICTSAHQRPARLIGFTLGVSYVREEVAMCRGDRLVADFTAGTETRPGLPEELEEHLTTTVDGLWVVWAHKLVFMPSRAEGCRGCLTGALSPR